MPVPTKGGYDWMPTQPVEVTVLPAIVEVEVTALPPVVEVEVITMPPVINVNIESADAAIPVTVDSITGDVDVNLPAAGETRDLIQSQINGVVGTMQTLDRKGKIYMSDGFESGMGCWSTSSTVDEFCWPSRSTRKDGLQSLAITLAHFGHSFTMNRRFAIPPSTKLGMEFSFSAPSKYYELLMHPHVYTGAIQWLPSIWLTISTGKLYYMNSASVYTQFATLPAMTYSYAYWYTMKFVFDMTLGQYISFIFNGKTYSLAGIALKQAATTDICQRCGLDVQSISGIGVFDVFYIDNVILTEEV